jgi:Uma2 family endonuclease
MGTTPTLLTIEEFRRLPKESGKLELIDGELIHSAPPTMFSHTRIIHRSYKALVPFEGAAGLGEVYIEAQYKLGEGTVVRPDISIAHPNQLVVSDDLVGAPALAIEVISPSNSAEEIDRKVSLYLSSGGIEVWLMYPRTRSVWIYREGHADEFRGSLQSVLIPGLEIDLERLFS